MTFGKRRWTLILTPGFGLASECDHIDHVCTQLPYAMTVGLVGLFAGTLLVAYLYPWWVGMLISLATLTAVLVAVGRPVEQAGSAQVRQVAAE